MESLVYSGGYILSFITYLTLALLFSFVPNKNVVTRGLVIFCLTFSIWGIGSNILFFATAEITTSYHFLLESIRYCGLLILLLALLSQHQGLFSIFKSPQFLSIFALLAAATAFTLIGDAFRQLGFTLILAVVIFLLVLLETIFAKAKQKLWALRPMILCLFAILIIDFSLYAEAALFVQFEPNLLIAKSYLNFLLAPLILWSVRRTTELQVKVYVSREVVFQSTVVLAAGVYLGLLATVGYYIKQFEQAWTPILQIVFITLGFVLLIAIMLSHSLKTNLKIFIQKNFFANKFDYRVQWLALTEELSKEKSAYKSALNTLLLSLNGAKGLIIKFNADKGQVVAVKGEFNHSEITQELNAVRDNRSAFEINKSEGFELLKAQNLDVAIPIADENKVWGIALISQNSENYISIDWEVSEYLHVVSIQVAQYLFMHEANELLMENAQFAAFSRMSAFVVHDLKNILAQVQMIVSNSAKHKNNPEFIDDTFETLAHTQARLSKVIKQLKEKKVESGELQVFDTKSVIEQAVNSRFSESDRIRLKLKLDVKIAADEDRFTNVICHIIDNALQASEPEDTVTITTDLNADMAVISVLDSGKGMTQEFIKNKLFKPFETTKGNAGMGIGAYDAKVFTEELKGKIDVISKVNEGTRFTLNIPVASQ